MQRAYKWKLGKRKQAYVIDPKQGKKLVWRRTDRCVHCPCIRYVKGAGFLDTHNLIKYRVAGFDHIGSEMPPCSKDSQPVVRLAGSWKHPWEFGPWEHASWEDGQGHHQQGRMRKGYCPVCGVESISRKPKVGKWRRYYILPGQHEELQYCPPCDDAR